MRAQRCALAAAALALATLLPSVDGDEQQRLPCGLARMKCLYRDGCRKALDNYMDGCLDIMNGHAKTCNDFCTKSLIALTSTQPGHALMECDCGEDQFCRATKRRLDPCRPQVQYANRNDTVVSCEVAQWICGADNLCGTALDYYFRNCRAMFAGRRCSRRCNNSISILQRQQRAAKLQTCACEGDAPARASCVDIKRNMDHLCFHKPVVDEEREEATNVIGGAAAQTLSAAVAIQVALVVWARWAAAHCW
ncbi:growth arrest-specific protein 1-like [Pollicipes pollicipes]|uniref:growth arrest-specific protein 1-like n=1 Tax=Pollicipes pollicipes TaxID=41117 RepID=UPI001884FAD7|nr:growth arrest-specific protein 1-like [Pollicipes pollicipes]XP_037074821.1 growth arrest-specific protein 1-like [Pollicipes pollicipes]